MSIYSRTGLVGAGFRWSHSIPILNDPWDGWTDGVKNGWTSWGFFMGGNGITWKILRLVGLKILNSWFSWWKILDDSHCLNPTEYEQRPTLLKSPLIKGYPPVNIGDPQLCGQHLGHGPSKWQEGWGSHQNGWEMNDLTEILWSWTMNTRDLKGYVTKHLTIWMCLKLGKILYP